MQSRRSVPRPLICCRTRTRPTLSSCLLKKFHAEMVDNFAENVPLLETIVDILNARKATYQHNAHMRESLRVAQALRGRASQTERGEIHTDFMHGSSVRWTCSSSTG